ncbi:MAG: EboA domain-containing protein [Siphonobacter aquaeclarae]|nr:EboA domain-containing protein [Siphonobacter aquaeclarae]
MYMTNESLLLLRRHLETLLERHLPESGWNWLRGNRPVLTAFVAAPRFTGKTVPPADDPLFADIEALRPGFTIKSWPADRLARLWLLLGLPLDDREAFLRSIETLFDTAEMNELVTLYASLPVLPFPDAWIFRATEAVRSNMGVVFDALALDNPYPSEQFSEPAWNQLVMKTIFNDKPLGRIIGLAERSNAALCRILVDFAHERWAAGRHVPPRAWEVVGPFIGENFLPDLERLFRSGRPEDRRAAALICRDTPFDPARVLGSTYATADGLDWSSVDE